MSAPLALSFDTATPYLISPWTYLNFVAFQAGILVRLTIFSQNYGFVHLVLASDTSLPNL